MGPVKSHPGVDVHSRLVPSSPSPTAVDRPEQGGVLVLTALEAIAVRVINADFVNKLGWHGPKPQASVRLAIRVVATTSTTDIIGAENKNRLSGKSGQRMGLAGFAPGVAIGGLSKAWACRGEGKGEGGYSSKGHKCGYDSYRLSYAGWGKLRRGGYLEVAGFRTRL